MAGSVETHFSLTSKSYVVNCGLVRVVLFGECRIVIDKNSTIGRLLLQITEYLNRNPHAADTLAGIESWWLSGAAHNISNSDLESAIHILVQRGMLQCNEQPDGTKTYSRVEHADCANEFDRVGG